MSKKKILIICIIFIALAGYVIWKFLNFEWMTEQDRAFLQKIELELKNSGDVVKVLDVHPGNWENVCAFSGGYDADIKKMIRNELERNSESFVIKNNAMDRISSTFDNSAIIFQYPTNELEVYHVTPVSPDSLSYESSSDNQNDCIERKRAHFRLLNSTRLQLISK